jgi:hypothetical protein
MNKKLYYGGAVSFLGLLVLSVVFYKERTMFSDMAFYLFNIVKDETFAFFHGRFIAAFTEVFPLVAVKASLPLQTVLLSYSVGVVLYNFAAYLICGSVFKRYDYALVILLINLLFITDVFFWMISELLLGLTLMIVFFALLTTPKFSNIGIRSILASIIFIPVLVFAHPMMLIAFSFTVIFFFLSKQTIAKQTLIMTVVIYVLVAIIKRKFFTDNYDEGAYGGLKNFVSFFPDYFSHYSQKNFVENWFRKYYWIPVLSIANVVFYFRERKFLKLLLFIAYSISLVMLVNISFPTSYTSDAYYENLYSPLAIIIGIPFVFDVLPALYKRKIGGWVIGAIAVTALLRISFYKPFKERLNWERNFMQAHSNEKLLIDKTQVPADKLVMIWATPYEFWLLSTIENGQTASLIIAEDANSLEWGTHSNNEWLSTWGAFKYSDLPKRYFKFSDSISNYRIVK